MGYAEVPIKNVRLIIIIIIVIRDMPCRGGGDIVARRAASVRWP